MGEKSMHTLPDDGFGTLAIHAGQDRIKCRLVFISTDTTIRAWGALRSDRATRARRTPVAMNRLSSLDPGEAINQSLAPWTDILVVLGLVDKVALAKEALCHID